MSSAILTCLLSMIPCQPDQHLLKRFKVDAPKAWKDYSQRIQSFEGRITLHFPPAKRQVVIKQRPGCVSMFFGEIQGGAATDSRESCHVINPQYSFVAQRGRHGDQWVVSEMHKINDGADLAARRGKIELVDELLFSPITFLGMHFKWKYLSQELGFMVKNTLLQAKDGSSCVRVDFEYRPKDRKPSNPSATGSLLFDADHHWVIKEFTADLRFQSKQDSVDVRIRKSGHFEYSLTGDGFPVPKIIVLTQQNMSKDVSSKTTWEYELNETQSPESDFYTPAFDLPEAGTIATKGTPWFIWLALVGIACIVLGAGCRKLRQRNDRAS